MKEIEVKARLNNKEEVMQKLSALGCVFEESITQNDTVYVKNIGSLEVFDSNDVFLRIRIKNKSKILFTLKKPLTNNLDAMEYETEIGSKEEMEQALLLMGYKPAMNIDKTRIITHYKGDEICLDEVENLGSFIEMEHLSPDADSETVQRELFAFLETVGVSAEDQIFDGYDILTLKLQNK